jgi:L-alanine-DL-glutamate epimerase-like enolase superfamily enzyme
VSAPLGDERLIASVTLRRLKLPLNRPYRLSYRTFEEFEPIIAEVVLDDGRVGWGEGHISPGSSKETREGGWAFACATAEKLVGELAARAYELVQTSAVASPVAATALACAIEMAAGHAALVIDEPIDLPLLAPINASDAPDIELEVSDLLGRGFRTFKVKVGKSVPDDLARVRVIQDAVDGRATLRLDANRGFDRERGIAFAKGLRPNAIELFEQPCATDAWDDNTAVAAASPVPLMLDEPICSIRDIKRAATIDGVAFCKVKLKRFGGIGRLREALEAIKAYDMGAILGDGLSSDIGCWMEACAGAGAISGAGEFNGFLKIRDPLLQPAIHFDNGHLHIAPGYWPTVNWDANAATVIQKRTFS